VQYPVTVMLKRRTDRARCFGAETASAVDASAGVDAQKLYFSLFDDFPDIHILPSFLRRFEFPDRYRFSFRQAVGCVVIFCSTAVELAATAMVHKKIPNQEKIYRFQRGHQAKQNRKDRQQNL
jgi:hypothetical protein